MMDTEVSSRPAGGHRLCVSLYGDDGRVLVLDGVTNPVFCLYRENREIILIGPPVIRMTVAGTGVVVGTRLDYDGVEIGRWPAAGPSALIAFDTTECVAGGDCEIRDLSIPADPDILDLLRPSIINW